MMKPTFESTMAAVGFAALSELLSATFPSSNAESQIMQTDAPVIVEQTFKAPAEKVWAAITEVDQMTQSHSTTSRPFEQK